MTSTRSSSQDRSPTAYHPVNDKQIKAQHSVRSATPEPPTMASVPTASPESPPDAVSTSNEKPPEFVPQYAEGLKVWIVVAPLSLTFFLVLLDTSIIATAIPQITNHFNSLEDVGWYGAAYQVASAVLQPLAGKIYTNFSNKWTFLSFFALFEFGSLLCGLANTSKMLIVGRAIAGMGTAGLQNGAMTILTALLPMHKRPAAMGIAQGVAQLGGAIGPVIGGALTQHASWRWCFYINLPPGALIAALLVYTDIPEMMYKPKPTVVVRDLHNKLDLLGFALFAPAIIMFLLAIQWGGNAYPWNSATIIGLFCGFGGNFLLWLAYDIWKGDEAMIPISMVRRTTVWSSCFTSGSLFAGLYVSAYYLPIYFQSSRDASPTMSGVYLLPNILSQLFAAIAAGRLVAVVGYYLPFSFASTALAAIGYGLTSTLSPTSSTGEWIGYQLLFGAGRGMGVQMPIVAVQNNLSPQHAALAIALLMFSGMMFGALFVSFSATIFTNSLRTLIPAVAPGADADAVIRAGATGFRDVVTDPGQVAGVMRAYARSVDRVFYLITALSAVSFLFVWGMGWVDIREKKKGKVDEDGEKGAKA